MSSTHGFRLVLIILLYNVALQETGGKIYDNDDNGREWIADDNPPAYADEIFINKTEMDEAYEAGVSEGGDDAYREDYDWQDLAGEVSKSSDESSDETVGKRITPTFRWPSGTVPYIINETHYDSIISDRIRQAMLIIQRSSCVVFRDMSNHKIMKKDFHSPWLSIKNPDHKRECKHKTTAGRNSVILVIGYDCIQPRDILHALMHVLGFQDEVTHPQRDLYIRVVWPNIQLKYRPLFYVQKGVPSKKMVEFDSMSVMHFHDRAYTINGGPTILPQIPGLLIAPSDTLSQLDVMKLRLAFGHECNKRKVANILRTCQNVFKKNDEDDDK